MLRSKLSHRIAGAGAIAWATGLLMLAWLPSAEAQTIEVPCESSALVGDLLAAYETPGSTETLALTAGCTYEIPAPSGVSPAYYDTDGTPFDWYGPSGLPAIDGTITIEGNGAAIAGGGAGSHYRLFYVAADPGNPSTENYASPGAGSLTLEDLTLQDGDAQGGSAIDAGGGAGMGGAIFNQGELTLDAVTLTGNVAQGGEVSQSASSATGGGGIGSDGSTDYSGGGFGSGSFGGAGGGSGSNIEFAGGGAGFAASETGGTPDGGGTASGLGGAGTTGLGGDGSGGGGEPVLTEGSPGGAFGEGGPANRPSITENNGGGGVGGGGSEGGGGGGFGGGGGYSGSGGFGGGSGADNGHAGFGGGGGTGAYGTGAGMGGAIFNMQGSVTILDSTLVANTAAPGAIGSVALSGSVEAGLGLGAAIFNLNGSLSLSGATIDQNTASPGGGGIYDLVLDSAKARTAQVSVADSILYGNDADVVANKPIDTVAGAENLGHASVEASGPDIVGRGEAVGAGTIAGSPSNANPHLGALADNGGPGMQTQLPAAGSPALGTGSQCPLTDERGDFRPTEGCDLGAVEITPVGTPSATITAPVNGASFSQGQTAIAVYACADPDGPGIASCIGNVPDGQPIDTATPGTFTFTVTARSADGQTATVSSSYTVIASATTTKPPQTQPGSPPSTTKPSTTAPSTKATIAIETAQAKVSAGKAKIKVDCTAAGKESVCKGMLSLSIRQRTVRKVHGHRKVSYTTIVLGRADYTISTGRSRTLLVRLTKAGLRALRQARQHQLHATLQVRLSSGKTLTREVLVKL